jgi:hypothetical protein
MKEKKSPWLGRRRNSFPTVQIGAAPAAAPLRECSVTPVQLDECTEDCASLIAEVHEGLQVHDPELCEEGVNGTYFLRNGQGKIVAVFKPEDEQGNSPKNPKNQDGSSSSDSDSNSLHAKGLLEGEVSLREVAAYLLDKRSNFFYKVPKTCLVKIIHPCFDVHNREQGKEKFGSLQQFVESDGSACDMGTAFYNVKDVHSLGILDLRIFNTDRHEGNILVSKSTPNCYSLTPIDHSYSLPHTLNAAWFDWLNWSQAKKPFDEETARHIESIDIEADIAMLYNKLYIRPECLRVMRISSTLLKKAVKYGLTLYDIGDAVCRKNLDEPSALEVMCNRAGQRIGMSMNAGMTSAQQEQCFFSALSNIMDEELGEWAGRNMDVD